MKKENEVIPGVPLIEDVPDKIRGQDYDDLFESGDLGRVKTLYPGFYASLFKHKFGKLPALNDSIAGKSNNVIITTMLFDALRKERITVELKATLAADYREKPEALKKVLDAMPPMDARMMDKYKDKSYDDLFMNGALADLKELHPEHYERLHKEKFGKGPKVK